MEYEIKPKEKTRLGLGELWQYRELFYFFTWRDIKVKYKQTVLGFAWAVLQPLLMMLIFTLFFGKTIALTNDTPYPVFVLSGLLVWNIFSSGITSAGNSMVANANIIKKIYFPRLIIPVSSILVSLFDFLMALVVFIALLIYFRVQPDIAHLVLFFPLGILMANLASLGTGTLLAALTIKYRDFRYVIPFMVQAMLFITPVIYPIHIISYKWAQFILAANPMYAPVSMFRSAFTGETLDVNFILLSTGTTFLLFIAGIFYFRKTESYFADIA
jgi:lipopolysaccharide transport system permease protein